MKTACVKIVYQDEDGSLYTVEESLAVLRKYSEYLDEALDRWAEQMYNVGLLTRVVSVFGVARVVEKSNG